MYCIHRYMYSIYLSTCIVYIDTCITYLNTCILIHVLHYIPQSTRRTTLYNYVHRYSCLMYHAALLTVWCVIHDHLNCTKITLKKSLSDFDNQFYSNSKLCNQYCNQLCNHLLIKKFSNEIIINIMSKFKLGINMTSKLKFVVTGHLIYFIFFF